MAASKLFPKENAGSQDFLAAADERMGQLRDLGAKPAQRYFGIGPRKKLSTDDKQLGQQLSQKHLEYYGKGMQKQRLEKGLTRMQRGREVNR